MTFEWTKERRSILVALWNQNLPVADIRRALGGRISATSIRSRIQIEQNGKEFKVERRTKGRRVSFWTEARIAKVLELRKQGLSNAQVGQRFIQNGKPVTERAVDNLFSRLRKRGVIE